MQIGGPAYLQKLVAGASFPQEAKMLRCRLRWGLRWWRHPRLYLLEVVAKV